ncbi:MAG TPA: tetratricopeptide repeat protein [Thermodesulfobacteriota bacterium]|nr:tetratricopeptide repeat protein [Thermodesulfobacteriota bacterium]
MARRTLRGSIVLFTALTALFLSTVPGGAAAFRNMKEGSPALPFTLKDFDGKDVEFRPGSGKVTILSFVKLSQDRSIDELKDLVALHKELSGKGIDILAVASYGDTPAEAKKAVSELGIAFPILHDKDQKVYGDYGLFILPATGVIGKDGKFAFEHSSHGPDFRDVVGGKAKVLARLMTAEEYTKLVTPVESVKKSREEGEASRLISLGRTLLKRGMPDKAAERFARAVELDPKNAAARIAYGESLVASKKYDEALAQFTKAKEIAPDNKDAGLGIGAVHLEKGEFDKAIREISDAAMLNPKPGKAYYWLGAAYEKKGDLPNAVKYYKKAVEKIIKE